MSSPESSKKEETDESNPEQKLIDAKKISVFRLYRFAGKAEKIALVFAVIVAAGLGVCMPLIGILLGDSTGDFGDDDGKSVLDNIEKNCLLMIYVGIAAFVLASLTEIIWSFVGNRLGVKVRKLYLEAVMKKDISWFDLNKPQELPTKIVSLISKYQNGIGDKVGKVIISLSMAVAGLIVSIVYGWQLALILIALSPITMVAAWLIGVANEMGMETSKRGYAKCGGYAEEALSAVRTVYAFCAENIEKNKYLNELANAQSATVKNAFILGLAVGLINFAMSLSHGLGYFIGSFLIQHDVYNHIKDKNYDAATVTIVFFTGLFATFSIGMIAPQMKDIGKAQVAAYDIYEIIDSVVDVGKDAPTDKIPMDQFKGKIEFKNVTFYYPTRPDVKILDNFSMVFESGQMVGICGETGSGKSTIIQLVERFYTPTSGTITVDGIDINTLDLKWWREMIGYVGQEPVLFNTTINGNIEYGRPGASEAEIKVVAKKANAVEFIEKLEKGYETITGTEGNKMSGGQKQRLAIARCLIKNPRILLLDEATSALDNTSEKKVQIAFNEMQKERGMTVLVIAHRLSTIKNADKIIVLHDGVLKEEGTDKELRSKNTIYANLCRLQEGGTEEGEIVVLESGEKMSLRKSSTVKKNSVKQENKQEETKITKEQEEAINKAKKEKEKAYKSELWKENMKHKLPFFGALIFSVLGGAYTPVTGVFFGMISIDLLETDDDELRRLVNLDFIGFLVSGFFGFIFTLVMLWLFGYVGAKITYRLRDKLYTNILKMDIGWFDSPDNLPANINGVLSEGTENINDVIGNIVGTILQTVSALIIAIALSFAFSWKMSLIILACVPIIGFSTFMETKFEVGFALEREKLYKDSMQILTEAVKNFRTVASFSSEERILKMYSDSLEKPLAQSQSGSLVSGLLYGVSQLIMYLVYAGIFYFSAYFLYKYEEKPRDTFIAVYSLLFSASAIGQMQQYSPDMGKAYAALSSVFGMIEQKPNIESPLVPTTNEIKGKIEFKNVYFKYPTRNDYVLQDFSATIEPGKKTAIVGISGSGKSTIIQLIERFYDVESGEILIDGVDIKKYSLNDLRKSIGFVPQEPILFDTTIEENVKYGSQTKTREEVEEACEIANATDFIMKDADAENINKIEIAIPTTERIIENIDIGKGYDRKVGAKGSLLSGGQKQRLAIARAVLKKPKIMLFDEATSALDSETEKVVQKALNQVSEGRTSIVIAHRLGTIEDDDTILVLENGKLIESGNKHQLITKKGSFYKLYGGVISAAHK